MILTQDHVLVKDFSFLLIPSLESYRIRVAKVAGKSNLQSGKYPEIGQN